MAFRSLTEAPASSDHNIPERFDIFEFIEYVRRHKFKVFLSCGVAVLLAASVSLLLPKRYTATASIMIQPPAGNDPRGAMAVSPVYLESLKTYEHFASSDSLFGQALKQLKVRETFASVPLETLKQKVLHVSKPRDTKILEISATLGNPKKAQALAQYIAEQTVGLNRSLDRQSQGDLTEEARKSLELASLRLKNAEHARNQFLASNPIGNLETDIEDMSMLQLQLQSDLTDERTDLAEYEARLNSLAKVESGQQEVATISQEAAATRARINALEDQAKEVEQKLKANALLLEQRRHDRDLLDAELQAARAQYESSRTKRDDILVSAAFRGERLEIIDPGVVPERASFPNLPLNIAIAALASLTGMILYLAGVFGYSRLRESHMQTRDRS